ncbi:MAG: RidA family protein [Pseudomonadota bacterium]
MTRLNVPSGSYLEPIIGFSRAVRVGNHVLVAGTAPIAEGGGTAGVGDVYAQTKRILEIIETALRDAGASMADVVRTRVMLTDATTWEQAAKAHGEAFANIRPACTVVEVAGFVDPDWLVELEVDAIVSD